MDFVEDRRDALPVFSSFKAWFSSSVSRERKLLWENHGGTTVMEVRNADYAFSDDCLADDTVRVHNMSDFHTGICIVFMSSWIEEAAKIPTPTCYGMEKFILVPKHVQDVFDVYKDRSRNEKHLKEKQRTNELAWNEFVQEWPAMKQRASNRKKKTNSSKSNSSLHVSTGVSSTLQNEEVPSSQNSRRRSPRELTREKNREHAAGGSSQQKANKRGIVRNKCSNNPSSDSASDGSDSESSLRTKNFNSESERLDHGKRKGKYIIRDNRRTGLTSRKQAGENSSEEVSSDESSPEADHQGHSSHKASEKQTCIRDSKQISSSQGSNVTVRDDAPLLESKKRKSSVSQQRTTRMKGAADLDEKDSQVSKGNDDSIKAQSSSKKKSAKSIKASKGKRMTDEEAVYKSHGDDIDEVDSIEPDTLRVVKKKKKLMKRTSESALSEIEAPAKVVDIAEETGTVLSTPTSTTCPALQQLSPKDINDLLGSKQQAQPSVSPRTTSNTTVSKLKGAGGTESPTLNGTRSGSSELRKETMKKHAEILEHKKKGQKCVEEFTYGSFSGFSHIDELDIPDVKMEDFIVNKNGCRVKRLTGSSPGE